MRNLITILLLALAFLFSSCDMMFQPVRGYFEEWTSEVSIQKFEVEGVETYYDKDGNLCIPSDHDAQVTFFMINPYHYDYCNEYSEKILDLNVLGNTISADPNDTTLLHMTYPSAFLGQHECGGDIGDNIELNHPLNGTKKTFSFKLKCNSRPPEPQNSTIMLSGNGDDATFILCFNLGSKDDLFKSGKIHRDVKTVSINGDVYELNFNSGGAVSVTPKDGGKLSTARPNNIVQNPAGSNSNFLDEPSKNSLYYSSGISNNNDMTFTIVLTDEAGLKNQVQVSSSAKKLSSPTLHNAQTGAALTSGGDINYIEFINGNIIEIKAPVTTVDGDGVDTSGMVTHYRIERLTTGNQEPNSFTGGNKTVNSNSSDFPNNNILGAAGDFEVTIWSEKSGYLKSDETVYIVYVKPKLTYTVRHLFQNIDNDNYSPDASYQDQTYTAFKGTTTQAQAYTNVTGFNTPSVSNEELISNNQVVVVRYNRKTYTLSYNTKVNGVTGPAQGTYRHGKVVTVSFATGTRTGYTLKGWATSNTATSPTYTSTGTNTITMTGNVNLFAVWQAETYTLTLDANGGKFSNNTTTLTKSVTYDAQYTGIPTTNPTRTGYKFEGWYTQQAGGDKVERTTPCSTAGDHTLHAHWTKEYYDCLPNLQYCTIDSITSTDSSGAKHAYGATVTMVIAANSDANGFYGLPENGLVITNHTTGGTITPTSKTEDGGEVTVKFTMPDSQVDISCRCKRAYKVRIQPYDCTYNGESSYVKNRLKNKKVRLWINADQGSFDNQYKEVTLDDDAKYYGTICFPDNVTPSHAKLVALTVYAVSGDDRGFGYLETGSGTGVIPLSMSIVEVRSNIDSSTKTVSMRSFNGPDSGWNYNNCGTMYMSNFGFSYSWKLYRTDSGTDVLMNTYSTGDTNSFSLNNLSLSNGKYCIGGTMTAAGIDFEGNGLGSTFFIPFN